MDFAIEFPEFPFVYAGLLAQMKLLVAGSKNSLKNLLAMFWDNSEIFWNQSYRSGYWDFLRDQDQRPRHYVVAGMVREYFPGGASVLEVGCGFAPALNLMKRTELDYHGIDLSSSAIEKCKKLHPEANCNFSVMRFESGKFDKKYDMVLVSEVLYYYPFWQIPKVIDRLFELTSEKGVVVVTMNKNPKAILVWFFLKKKARLVESLSASNSRGSKWKIRVFKRL